MNFITNRKREGSMKKSVDDLLTSSQDVIDQAISLSTSAANNQPKAKRSPSPKKSHKRDKSDVSTFSSENVEVDARHSRRRSPSPDVSNKSQDELRDSRRNSPGGSKLAERAKKKAWYNVIYPSYKSRAEDFRKLFNVPEDERLVVDYSCAIQKDILVHGRLYVSQNYLCFHANIIVYETRFVIKWKDVTSISKEKVAKVIPNAILVTTETDKYFLTSFASRDKAYVILFRLWQNALMDKPMNPQELWQSVHNCYGEQLGLTSDDEDYIDPYDTKLSADSVSEGPEAKASSSSSGNKLNDKKSKKELKKELKKSKKSSSSSSSFTPQGAKDKILVTPPTPTEAPSTSIADHPKLQLSKSLKLCPTDMSDNSSDSEKGKKMDFVNDAECNSMHEGRQLVHTILPINIETVFGLLFHKSKFFTEFHKMRKTTDLVQGEWIDLPDGTKQRIISLTVAITQVVGPKSSQVTETQVMRSCSKPGQLYSIDASSVNAGIPYADSFYVMLHYCMKRTVDDSTVMSVHAQIKYKKSVWGVIKGFIEKNTWLGLEEFYESLSKALMAEYCLPPAKAKSRRPRKSSSIPLQLTNSTQAALPTKHQHAHEKDIDKMQSSMPMRGHDVRQASAIHEVESSRHSNRRHEKLSWIVIILLVTLIGFNVILYVKLWRLEGPEEDSLHKKLEFLRNPPSSPDEWIQLLQLQEKLHAKEMKSWQQVIQTAIDLLRKTEQSLSELQNLILTHRTRLSADKFTSVGGDGS